MGPCTSYFQRLTTGGTGGQDIGGRQLSAGHLLLACVPHTRCGMGQALSRGSLPAEACSTCCCRRGPAQLSAAATVAQRLSRARSLASQRGLSSVYITASPLASDSVHTERRALLAVDARRRPARKCRSAAAVHEPLLWRAGCETLRGKRAGDATRSGRGGCTQAIGMSGC